MPLFNSFSESAARGLGVGAGKIMPPDVPVIVTPTGGSTLTTVETAEVTFTSITTTYPILKHQYKVGAGGTFVDVSTSPFTITGLTQGTSYDIYMKTIDITNAESDTTAARSFTTKSTVQIQAPTPILSSPSITHPDRIVINITYSAGIPSGGTSMILRQYAVTTSTATPSTWSTFSGTSGTVPEYTTTAGVNLATNTTYYVHFKYTDNSTPTNLTSLTYNSITTAAENAPGIPAASTFTKTGTSTATLQRGASTKGTYDVAYEYRYWASDASSSVAATGTFQSMTSNPTSLTGLNPNTYYDAQVRAVNVSPGTQVSSARDYGVIQTDPNAPGVPVVVWHHTMTSTMANSAYLRVYPSTNASYVKVSRNGGAEWTSPGIGSSNANFTWNHLNQMWIFSETGLTFNTTYTYQARAFNRVDVASSYSGNFTYTTARKNIPFNEGAAADAFGDNAGFIIDNTVRYVVRTDIAVAGCQQYLGVTFPSVPATDNEVGYRNITSIGIGHVVSGNASNPNFSGRLLYFSIADNPTTGAGEVYTNAGNIGTAGNLGAQTTNWYLNPGSGLNWAVNGISLGGTTLSGKTIFLRVLGNMANLVAGCAVGTAPYNNYFLANRFYVQGTYTGESSTSGAKATSATSVP